MHDYVAGKAAWLAAGLPSQGSVDDDQRAAAAVARAPKRHVVVSARASVAEALAAARDEQGADLIILLHDGGVLAAAAELETVESASTGSTLASIADVDPPATRPNTTAEELVDRVRSDDLPWVAVTAADGRFLGVIDGPALLELARHDRRP